MEDSSSIHGHAVDSVVWLSIQRYPWWPCKVVKLDGEEKLRLESFGDKVIFSLKPKKMKEFTCEEARELVMKTKKKLRHKKTELQLFNDAVQDAMEHVQQSEPSFAFDFDPLADISTLSDTSFTGSTPGRPNTSFTTPQSFANHSIYTTGTDSHTGSARITRSTGKRKPGKLGVTETPPRSGDILSANSRSRKRKGVSPEIKSERKKAKTSSQVHIDPVKKKLFKEDILTKLSKNRGNLCQNGEKVHFQKDNGEEEAKPLGNGTHSHQLVSDMEDQHLEEHHQREEERNNQPLKSGGVESQDKRGPSNKERISKFCESLISSRPAAPEMSAFKSPVLEIEMKMTEPMSLTSTPHHKDSPSIVAAIDDDGGEQLASSMDSETPGCCDDSSTFDSDEEDMRSLAVSESGDDSLPDVDFNVNEAVKIHELKSEDVVWIKYNRYPFWPAMVLSVKAPKKSQKSKSTARIVFFGFNDAAVRISKSTNVAMFGTNKTDEFLENGRSCSNHEAFEQAFEEASNLLSLRASKQIEGSAMEQYRKMVERRPKDFTALVSPLAELKPVAPPSNEDSPTSIESSLNIYQDDSEGESTVMSDEEEENDPDGPYCWENVLTVLQEIKPELVGIAQGKIHSDLHNTFQHGSTKEKARLKNAYPKELMKWPNKKVNKLVNELISVAGETLGGTQLYYVMNVLLAEATVRVISKIDNISMEEAAARL